MNVDTFMYSPTPNILSLFGRIILLSSDLLVWIMKVLGKPGGRLVG